MQSGAHHRYGAAITATGGGRLFRLVTLGESMVLTAGLLRRIAGQVIWAWASTPIIIGDPDPALANHQPIAALQGMVLVYPHGPRPAGYSSFDIALWPDLLEYEPMILVMLGRPEGWPP